jgi:hypothetical protein
MKALSSAIRLEKATDRQRLALIDLPGFRLTPTSSMPLLSFGDNRPSKARFTSLPPGDSEIAVN